MKFKFWALLVFWLLCLFISDVHELTKNQSTVLIYAPHLSKNNIEFIKSIDNVRVSASKTDDSILIPASGDFDESTLIRIVNIATDF